MTAASSQKHFDDLLANLCETAASPNSGPEEFQKAIEPIWRSAGRLEGGIDHALRGLAPAFSAPHPGRAGFVALCCGGLVEQGGDPRIVLPAYLARLAAILPDCEAFAAACAGLAASGEENTPLDEVVQAHAQEAAQSQPELARAWSGLDLFGRAGIALLSHSKEGRRLVHQEQALRAAIHRIASANEWANWMDRLLDVLDDEEMIVIHPEQGRGYRVQVSGIADNFQLHTLLVDALIGDPAQGWLAGERPDEKVAAIARGIETGTGDETATGIFNLVNWRGIQPDGLLKDGKGEPDHWIWGEGTLQEIERLDGKLIVLLGQASYGRYWNAERKFSGMQAEFRVLEKMDPAGVIGWVRRIVEAAHPG